MQECPVQDSFAESYKPVQNQAIDEGMISIKSRLCYLQYFSSKPVKREIEVLM